jgi:hypothetical protein
LPTDAEVRSRIQDVYAGFWQEIAIAVYSRAEHIFVQRKFPGTRQAAEGYLRLVKARGVRDGEKNHIAEVEADLKSLAPMQD